MVYQEKQTVYSPISDPQGDYTHHDFSFEEVSAATKLNRHMTAKEQLELYIPAETVRLSVVWFVHELRKQIEATEDRLILVFNLMGAYWFTNLILEAYEAEFGSSLLDEVELHPIRVSTSHGYQDFNEEASQEQLLWPFAPHSLGDRTVFSLEDIGDRGRTQQIIKELAYRDGAQNVLTVNLFEKLRDDITKHEEPDYVLLIVAQFFLLGVGLDSGTDNLTRELAFRQLKTVAKLHAITETEALAR